MKIEELRGSKWEESIIWLQQIQVKRCKEYSLKVNLHSDHGSTVVQQSASTVAICGPHYHHQTAVNMHCIVVLLSWVGEPLL